MKKCKKCGKEIEEHQTYCDRKCFFEYARREKSKCEFCDRTEFIKRKRIHVKKDNKLEPEHVHLCGKCRRILNGNRTNPLSKKELREIVT